ncbi:DUF5333 domain-containing protein [Paracoccus sp. S3-43]|uniref:DUF5333 domain-containing protein n=1 Tax=Paracoccus sp. S3-43 TaxID=3030011 RepID=UPI0023B2047A|nr:DUF5333 domain-containing protein [Paracoccus sp. S3-43]WEF23263.1 DUF5333 domain-containing protein [Paracoccus sp. S3-43]
MTGLAAYSRKARAALLALSCGAALAAPAWALPPLSQERHINDSLIQARVADVLRKGCPSLEARLIRAFSEARKLKRYAQDQGYSEVEIDAFLDSKEERRRIYAEADRYMVANGVVNGQPETFCRLGRQEIERKTIAGSLLVAR